MLLPTSLVGSLPQPDWLVDRDNLRGRFPPRVRAREIWKVPAAVLAEAQDDATLAAIKLQEDAGLDIITIRQVLETGRSICFFPEATTKGGKEVLPFRASLFSALYPPIPGLVVQPIAIDYGDKHDVVAWGDESGGTVGPRLSAGRSGDHRVGQRGESGCRVTDEGDEASRRCDPTLDLLGIEIDAHHRPTEGQSSATVVEIGIADLAPEDEDHVSCFQRLLHA